MQYPRGLLALPSNARGVPPRAEKEEGMNDWLHNLPIIWMAVLIFGVTYLIALAIFAVVMILATGERARGFRAASPECCLHWVYFSASSWRLSRPKLE
jgi:hypothetical protein